jgi:hypothetical protein
MDFLPRQAAMAIKISTIVEATTSLSAVFSGVLPAFGLAHPDDWR